MKEDQEGKTAGRSQGDLNVTQVAWNRREPPGEKMSTGVVIIMQREGTGGGGAGTDRNLHGGEEAGLTPRPH